MEQTNPPMFFISRNLAFRILRDREEQAIELKKQEEKRQSLIAQRKEMLACLEKKHTRQLLNMLVEMRVRQTCCEFDNEYCWHSVNMRPSIKDVKAILAKRPHIPNKIESRRKRQEAAKKSRHGKSRNTLKWSKSYAR